jgi:hypothetical protein
MLRTTYWQIREIFGEWRRRARSRLELALLGQAERQELHRRFDIHAEMGKWFWQA